MAAGSNPLAEIVPIRSALHREMQLVREAISMVASGKSPRVVIAGIVYTDVLVDAAERLAADAGVLLTALRRVDESGDDISVEQLPE